MPWADLVVAVPCGRAVHTDSWAAVASVDSAFQLDGHHPSCFQVPKAVVRGHEEGFAHVHPIEGLADRLWYQQADRLEDGRPVAVAPPPGLAVRLWVGP